MWQKEETLKLCEESVPLWCTRFAVELFTVLLISSKFSSIIIVFYLLQAILWWLIAFRVISKQPFQIRFLDISKQTCFHDLTVSKMNFFVLLWRFFEILAPFYIAKHFWKYQTMFSKKNLTWVNNLKMRWLVNPGGALPYKPIRDVPFFRVLFFSINSWTGYENWSEIPKRVMTICSRTKGYCFQEQNAIVFKNNRLLFSQLFSSCFVILFCTLTPINSWTGYENWSEIPKRVMTICSRTKGYCFQKQNAIVFKNNRLLFSQLFSSCFVI